MTIETRSPEETFETGFRMGERARAGQVYTLAGDLGVGKTVFTQGFAKGLGVEEHVNSPTFTIVQEYEDGRMPFYHFDVYRIGDIEEMDEIGFEEYKMCIRDRYDSVAVDQSVCPSCKINGGTDLYR